MSLVIVDDLLLSSLRRIWRILKLVIRNDN
jgi:hypothetical protein